MADSTRGVVFRFRLTKAERAGLAARAAAAGLSESEYARRMVLGQAVSPASAPSAAAGAVAADSGLCGRCGVRLTITRRAAGGRLCATCEKA